MNGWTNSLFGNPVFYYINAFRGFVNGLEANPFSVFYQKSPHLRNSFKLDNFLCSITVNMNEVHTFKKIFTNPSAVL